MNTLDTVLNTLNNLPDCIESIDNLLTNHGWLLFAMATMWRMGPYFMTFVERLLH